VPSESAKVIIDAEDLASKKIAEAARNVEANIKSIKDVGGKAKASTEFIGTLATTLGGSQFGSYAGQLAQLTERVSAFSEVSKAGGAGALAFKAGLASVVAVLAFQVGKAIGDVVFQTGKLERAFTRTKEAAAELNAELARARDQTFSDQKEDIDLIRDPEEKRAAQEALFKQLDNDVQGITQQLKESTKAADEWADAWQITGNRKAYAEEAQKQVEIDKQRLSQAKEMRDELRRELSDRKAINDQIRADNQAAIEAEKNAAAERIAAEKAADDARISAANKAFDDARKLEDIKQREIDRLEEQRILLEQGAEAAKAFSLEQQGLDKATAERLAREGAVLEERRKQAEEEKAGGTGTQQVGTQAVQSRLLTRGPAERGIDKIAKSAEKHTSLLSEIKEALGKQLKSQPEFELIK